MVRVVFILWFLRRSELAQVPASGSRKPRPASRAPLPLPLHLQVHARPRPRSRSRAARRGRAGSLVATLVAPPDARAPGPLRDAGAAGRRPAVPRRHCFRLRLPAPGGNGPRAGSREARRRIRAAARAPAAAGAPGTADAHRPRHLQQGSRRRGVRRPGGIHGDPVPRAAGADVDRRAPPHQGQLRSAQRGEPPGARRR